MGYRCRLLARGVHGMPAGDAQGVYAADAGQQRDACALMHVELIDKAFVPIASRDLARVVDTWRAVRNRCPPTVVLL